MENKLTTKMIYDALENICPNFVIETDLQGQIVIYTAMSYKDKHSDEIVPYSSRD